MKEVEKYPERIPLFKEALLYADPQQAKNLLSNYWKRSADICRYHLEEMGVSGHMLKKLARGFDVMIEDEASLSENFGGFEFKTRYLDGLMKASVVRIADSVEPEFKNRTLTISSNYFYEEKRRAIFSHAPLARIPEICFANGGIPVFTRDEQRQLNGMRSEEL